MDIMIERFINVAGAFLVLSLVVEKINDFIKLRNPELSTRTQQGVKKADEKEKEREKRILFRNILVGVVLAIFLKADAFQMLISGQPDEVLGWENVLFYKSNQEAIQEFSFQNQLYFTHLSFQDDIGKGIYTWLFNLIGMFVTGVALSFGSKFWHDVLGILYEVKRTKENVRKKPQPDQ